jgi:uncharacterized membrane protein
LGRKEELVALGIVIIAVGIALTALTAVYNYNRFTGALTSIQLPMLPYGFALGVIGVFFVALGIIIKEEPPTTQIPSPISPPPIPPPPTVAQAQVKYCRYCGTQNKVDSIYCIKCGKPLR